MGVFIGIDVGTGSARAGVFDRSGRLLASASAPIAAHWPRPDFAQQSSSDIWAAVATACRDAMAEIHAPAEGLGFDATCSLVVQDAAGAPVSVCPDGTAAQDVMLWMDHRAIADAEAINATGAAVLAHVGGVISPEMQMPKLRWLKRELPQAWARAVRFWDLPDWLAHRATGTETRSLCSAVCKWTYLGHKGTGGEGWDTGFLAEIGLGDLAVDLPRIGTRFAVPGEAVGRLSARAAAELGLPEGLPVSAGMIDAYAGALGTIGAAPERGSEARLAVIAGTSACHILTAPDAVFVPGVWGPYLSVLLGGVWANEGGQSAAGALIDAVLARHAAFAGVQAEASKEGLRPTDVLDARLAALAPETATLTRGRHLQPDFHGNRSPLADPTRHGAISGLSLAHDADDLALDYLATVQALAYGTRHIITEMRAAGALVDVIVVSGGLAKNALYLRETADATGCTVLVPDQSEPVLLGAAMLGAVAGGGFADLPAAMAAMSGPVAAIAPRGGAIAAYHDAKYAVFRRMQDDFQAYAALMAAAGE
ncbi:MAG: FGGY-family carbohydrate kinase [Rhodobacteraceae bacterium]|nr:FGGY-family carbohydrate kinase [Paracoccaceae bacterium]